MPSVLNIMSFVQLLALLAPVTATTYRAGIEMRDIMEEVEHVLVDNGGKNSDGLYNAVNPCSSYVGSSLLGETNAGQWIRLPFHDFVTADISAGTGGLDASIGFESNRVENAGAFVNTSLRFFGPDINAFMSMSDMIALGAVVSVASCSASKTSSIALRAGRVDATEAGPSGVPEPTTDLDTTLARFELAGFNQTDTIALTACGHTVGHIHYSNFPDIVDESYVTSTNTEGAEGFDTTPITFDNTLVNEFLDGTGQMGGPLVTALNISDRSDYRLYSSDNNVTMQSLATETAYDTRCFGLFERMLNTVPSSVILSDIITPMVWKGVDVIMDISTSGTVSLAGSIRNLYDSTTTEPVTTVSYTYTSTSGNSSDLISDAYDSTTGAGTSQFGSTAYYSFNTTIESPGTSYLTIESSISYPINDEIFVLPNWSIVSQRAGTITLVAAALTSTLSANETMTGVLMVPTSQSGTVSQAIVNSTITMTEFATAGDYTLFEGDYTSASSGGRGGGGGSTIVTKVFLGDGDVTVSRPVKSDSFVRSN